MTAPLKQVPGDEPRRIGGVMIVLCWVAVIATITLLFNKFFEDQHNPNSQFSTEQLVGGKVQVRLRQNAMGHYVATGTLNGEATVFLLDTGATTVSVPDGLAKTLQLKRGAPMRSQTANGSVITYQTRLDEVSLGGIVMHNVRANINPGMAGTEVLLGMSFLRHLDMRQQNGTLTLSKMPQ